MNPAVFLKTVREYGPKWVFWRAVYGVAMKTGHFRRGLHAGQDPVRVLVADMAGPERESAAWLASRWGESRGAFFLPSAAAARDLPAETRTRILQQADAVLAGKYRIFAEQRELGFPPNWFQGQAGFSAWPHDRHWSFIADLGSTNGDIKYVWELSRFGHAYDLCRAYRCSGDEKYAQGFWELCESWWAANPLEIGPHWRCGQEMSFRILAWTFALQTLEKAASSTPDRIGTLIAHLWHHGRHVAKVSWYAERCVRNNHAISEAVALRTLGTLFPFLPEADRWRHKAARSLVREISWQVYADGTYVQQSNIYARLVAQLLTWVLCLERSNGQALVVSDILPQKAGLLVDQLRDQLAGAEGQLPNYGSNDGTLLFPWSGAAYRDFRPSLHALSRALGRAGLPGEGPWQEEAFWFGLHTDVSPTHAGADQSDGSTVQTYPAGGLNVMRGSNSLVLFRCGPNANRPGEADMMHVDYWYKGVNVLLDAGTFGYNVPRQTRDYFAGSRSHNTVTVDGADQMRRGARFLWHDWVQGRLESHSVDAGEAIARGRHDGYRPVTHRRAVHLQNNSILVVDDLWGAPQACEFRLHWLMQDLAVHELAVHDLAQGAEMVLDDGERVVVKVWSDQPVQDDLIRDRHDELRGVWSPHYGVMKPAWSLAVVARAKKNRFVTFAGPAAVYAEMGEVGQPGPEKDTAAVLAAWRAMAPSNPGNGLT